MEVSIDHDRLKEGMGKDIVLDIDGIKVKCNVEIVSDKKTSLRPKPVKDNNFSLNHDNLKVNSDFNSCHDMNSFTEKYNEYTNFKQEFYEALEHFMIDPEYKGNVDINDEDFDDDGLNIQVSPHNHDDWFLKYHDTFCSKFNLQLLKAIPVCNGNVNYIYKNKME